MRTFARFSGVILLVSGFLTLNSGVAAADGYKDCYPDNGKVALTSEFWSNSGLDLVIADGAGGGGGTTSWSRTIDPELYKPLFSPHWTVSTGLSKGDWGVAEARSAGNGILSEHAQCTVKPLRSGTPAKTWTFGARDCPDGQVVALHTSGYGNHWFEWNIGDSKRRVSMTQYGGIQEFFHVYTRANNYGGGIARAYVTDTANSEGQILSGGFSSCIPANHWKPGD